MTYEEALEIYKLGNYGSELSKAEADYWLANIDTATELAFKCLELQIPKKPILKDGESVLCVDYADGSGEVKRNKWREWTCPDCSWFVGEQYVRINGKIHNQKKCNFCSDCGKAIDWSEVE